MARRSRRMAGLKIEETVADASSYFNGGDVTHDSVGEITSPPETVSELPEDDENEDEDDEKLDLKWGDNLAEGMKEGDLTTLGKELLAGFEIDLKSREVWEKDLALGIDRLGIKLESFDQPFKGSCSATVPLIERHARAFQSRALRHAFPSAGPVKTRVYGKVTEEKQAAAGRVKLYQNWQLMHQMPDYFDDTDQMFYYLALTGSTFRKLYHNERFSRPSARFLRVDEYVVNYGCTSLHNAERQTHVFEETKDECIRAKLSGKYLDVELPKPEGTGLRNRGKVTEAADKATGQAAPAGDIVGTDAPVIYMFLEMQTMLDLKGFEHEVDGELTGMRLPYLVTLDRDSGKVLRIVHNSLEGDDSHEPVDHVVHYRFMPGLGFYGQGYLQLLGNIQESATTALRSLADSGQFANLQGGFKQRGLKMGDDDGAQAIGFGEWVEIEAFGDDLRKNLYPLPYKEPSATLLALMKEMSTMGTQLGAVVDLDMNQVGTKEAPVGTVSQMLEQTLDQLGGVIMRIHRAQSQEFAILRRLNQENLPEEGYPFEVSGAEASIMVEDFQYTEIVPISEPQAFTSAQRVAKAQAGIELAKQFPQLYDLSEANRMLLQSLEFTDEEIEAILPDYGEPGPMDPATEMFAILQNQATKAYPAQNHQAHIQYLTAKKSDPQTAQAAGSSPPAAQALMAKIDAAISMHMAYLQRAEIVAAMGVQLPPAPDYSAVEPPHPVAYPEPEIEAAHNMAAAQAQAAAQLAQQRMSMQQMQKNQQASQDPIVKLKEAENQLKAMKQQADAKAGTREADRKDAQAIHDTKMDIRDQNRDDLELALDEENVQADNTRDDKRLDIEQDRVDVEARRVAQEKNRNNKPQ